MNVYLVIALCFIPLILIFVLSTFFTKLKISTGIISVLFALLSVIPITFIQYLLTEFLPSDFFSIKNGIFFLFVKVLFFAGFLEESLKFLILFLFPSKKLNLKQFMAAALIFGITLGCFESAVYYLNSLHRTQIRHAELIYSLIFTRMISSDLIHAFCAGLSAFSVFAAKNKKIYISPVIISILIHGIFDLFQYFDNAIKYFSIAAILFAVIELRVKYSVLKEYFTAKTQESNPPQNKKKPYTKKKKVSQSKTKTEHE